MNVKTVSYGRTIVLSERRGIAQEKCWFGWEAEVSEGETAAQVLDALHSVADAAEADERRAYEERRYATPHPYSTPT